MFYFSPQPINKLIINLPINTYLSFLFLFFYLNIYSKIPHNQTTKNLQKSNTKNLSTNRTFNNNYIYIQSSKKIINNLTKKKTIYHYNINLYTTITKSPIILIPLLQIYNQNIYNYQIFITLIY